MNFDGLAQLCEAAGFAAGDEHLAGDDLVENEVLAALVQFGQNIVQEQHGLFTHFPAHELPLGQLQGDGRGAGLSLGAVGFQVDAGEGNVEIVLVVAGSGSFVLLS